MEHRHWNIAIGKPAKAGVSLFRRLSVKLRGQAGVYSWKHETLDMTNRKDSLLKVWNVKNARITK